MKKVFVILMCIMFLAMPLFANGTNEASNVVSKNGSEKPIVITMTYWGSPAEKTAVEASIATFEAAHPGVEVKGMHIPSDNFLTKLNSMIAAGNTPDISYSASWKFQFGKDGLIYNFFDLMKDDPTMSVDDYLKTCWWNWSPTESAGPIMANIAPSLMYNVDLFKEAGIELPPTTVETAWSWDKFVKVAQELTLDTKGRNALDPNFDANNIKQFGVQFSLDWISYMPFVYSNGGYYLSKDMKSFGLEEHAAAEALQRIADLINVYHVHPTAVQTNSMPAPATALQSRRVAMYIGGSWNHLDLAEAGLNWGVGVLPIDKNYTTFFDGGSLIIFKSCKHLKETWELYKWITDPQSSKEITNMFRSIWMPVQTKYYTDPKLVQFWASEDLPARPKGFIDCMVKATYEHSVIPTEIDVVNYDQISVLVTSALDQVWAGEKTAVEALTEIKPKIDALVEGTYSGKRS
jgi:multiple sugar transport system substrate-binding protein